MAHGGGRSARVAKAARAAATRGLLGVSVVAAVAVGAIGAGAAACQKPPPIVAAPDTAASASAPTAAARASASAPAPRSPRIEEAAVVAALAPRDFFDNDPFPLTLYTWTTDEQAETLRQNRALLVRGAVDGQGLSGYNGMLWSLYGVDPVARLLLNPPFHLQRYAWPFPWATRLGGDDRSYGDHLIRMDLRANAIFARFRPQVEIPAERWAFFDRERHRLTTQEFLKRAADLVAVYHLREVNPASGGLAFREFVVVNEAQVVEWSIGTDEINNAIDADRAALGLLAQFVSEQLDWAASADEFEWNAAVLANSWGPRPPQLSPELAYTAGLAFANSRYLPGKTQLDALLKSLKLVHQPGPPLRHSPTVPRPRAPLLPPPPLPGAQPDPCAPGDNTFDCGVIAAQVHLCRTPTGFVRRCP